MEKLLQRTFKRREFGTHGRKWYTDEIGNIAFSIYINTNQCDISKIDGLTIKIAEIIIEVFKKLYKIELQIKSPNDIVYKNKKIGGILTQAKIQGNKVKYIVIGIGINTNQKKFNKQIEKIATSIKNEFEIEVERNEFIEAFCNLLEKNLKERFK